jgi:hypothetical protein
MPTPHENARPLSVFDAPRARENSRKPDEAYEIIERMYPTLPKIELFARNKRKGWTVVGQRSAERRLRWQRRHEPLADQQVWHAACGGLQFCSHANRAAK